MKDDNNISVKQGNRIKRTSCWFNGTTHSPADIENIKRYIINFPFYAYILHNPDEDNGHLHIHFLVFTRGQVSIKSVAEKLECDYGVVQDTRQEKTYARYMLHLGFSDKKDKYTLDCVVSSDKDRFSSFLSDFSTPVSSLFEDFSALKNGRISRIDFIEKYKGEFSHLNFYQKIRVFSEIERLSRF